ncbi:uncharacterized protein CDAR_310571 [Caerostris darwini]|uniref:Uncharacterized protein n=1 Tax=Caerostris darwini TaxID=1538125 RepID=A0AAV4WSB6_9ARAC|nr:uncharacterized protein CDAR_310571 [Caerostris darwini]
MCWILTSTKIMAEFIGCKDESVETKNSISPPQVAKRPNIRLGPNVPFTQDSIRGRGSSFTHLEYSPLHVPQRQQYVYNSPYHIPLIEEASHVSGSSIIYEADRPGTPAPGDQRNVVVVDDAPSRLYRNSLDEDSIIDGPAYQRDNFVVDRHLPANISFPLATLAKFEDNDVGKECEENNFLLYEVV